MVESTFITLPGLGQVAVTQYLAEKLEDNVLSKETAAAWAKREGVKFYLVNEKFSSAQYLLPMMLTTQITRDEELKGYWNGRKNYRSKYSRASASDPCDGRP
ncbi:hypothetical protein OL548_20395 [Lysinibacillus sp. MHQ-1]|nr:hypothetical protein OL548_20395 [Lysinibacillus sp. MHQ-1]